MGATRSDETQGSGARGGRWGTSAQSDPSGGGTPARSFEAARVGEEEVPRDGRAQAEGPKGRHAAPGPRVYLGRRSPCLGGGRAAAGVEAGVAGAVGTERAAPGVARRLRTSQLNRLKRRGIT